ncbi:hypothetical protein M9434_002472 [Picochlorum sp. BPE23]|nr:hypothetical protein M9434_002472 [Picochlorum sp. BPE23]|mmetsp:Transcript_10487/g.20717  ORF Transcript_10487/g.20717 Transcript_10487/m.20717 type:complete len:685 (-) Transcript_10487:264-2318(-)|eukprot:CAMPEP_0118808802 /NCGR_PEP_ID=MMETSP1161-20130426/36167_1 /TAXON_ID=249345 /ORGANISM="Picochlorum oklahomensis, Strain CCMP2329" /LENGTH=684 /DNA_ID=CAMNT_0006738195 /DNA_START=125 /DNA_END=2179 /DNA_ORIENTATION=+
MSSSVGQQQPLVHPLQTLKCLQFRHDCQHLGCAHPKCPQCVLCQKRRCAGSFKKKYLAPSDVLEAECGAQVYVVVVDAATGALVQYGLEDTYLQLSLVDGRKLELEGEKEEALDGCQLLTNKAGQALLVHGRSGAYTDDKRVVVPMISGQAMLPDLKVTDSSEALLTGRAPPFRLLARVVQRGGIPLPGIAPVLSEPFVVATARVRGAAKAEIPHVDDSVSKLEGLGVQTQKKLEDIGAAARASNVTNLQVPINSVTKVGQFRELVETAERNKPLRETLKQVLRLTKMWDVARDHVRKAVHTDVQLRVYHPDGREDVGLVYRCGAFNVVDINRPVGLLRKRQESTKPGQQLVDIIWLASDISTWPDAVRRIVPRAASAWWQDGHPGWAFLPLTTSHLPEISPNGEPKPSMSSFSFTAKPQGGIDSGGRSQLPLSGGDVHAGPQPGYRTVPNYSQPPFPPSSVPGGFNSGGLPLSGGSSGAVPNALFNNNPSNGSPFEDPSFQKLMHMVSGNPAERGAPPRSTESDGGSKGKRKADASLETWMNMNKSIDIDLDLPSTLAGVESLLAAGMFGSGGKGKLNGGMDGSLLAGLGSLEGQDKQAPFQMKPSSLPDSAPVQIPGLTMGQLREEFAHFLQSDDPEAKAGMEAFLMKHGLLPQAQRVKDDPGGLETMKSIENNLPDLDGDV